MHRKNTFLLQIAIFSFITFLLFTANLNAGSLNPPSYAVDANGNPVPTPMTQSWSTRISDVNKRFKDIFPFTNILGSFYAGVLDNETGLVWEKGVGSFQQTYNGNGCIFPGNNSGYEIPTTGELESLLGRGNVPASLFGFTASQKIWTKEGYVTVTLNGSNLSANSGADNHTGTGVFWCVRGPK